VKVSSPIGDLPFEPRSVRFRGGGLEIDGVMGAWPAQVRIGLADAPSVLRLLAKPAAVATAVFTVVGVATRARSNLHLTGKERR
jgi:hypothetical protein